MGGLFLNKKAAVLLSVLCLLFFSSCRNASPESAADELSAHNRISEDKRISLTFQGDNACLSGKELSVSGEYFADDKKLIIVSKDMGTLSLPYHFQDGKLILEYQGMKISLGDL